MTDQIKFTQKLKAKTVLIIGGTSGIGFAVAEAAVENGATVIVSSSNPSKVEQAVSRLQEAYPSSSDRISGHACNLGDEDTLESNVVALFEKAGKCDHIVSTAGDGMAPIKLTEMDMAKIKKAGMVRYFSTLMIGKHAPKYLRGGRESSIILTAGTVSQRPLPDWTVVNGYSTGLHGVTRGLALDLKPIRVNLVAPGAVNTEHWAHSGMSKDDKNGLFRFIESKLPTGQIPGPEDVAEAYLYLMKDANITGTVISTNGGALLV